MDDYGYGGYDFSGADWNSGYDYGGGGYDYGGGGSGVTQIDPWGSPRLESYPGGGQYSIGDNIYDIYAPGGDTRGGGQYMSAGEYDAMRGAPPNPRTSGYTQWSSAYEPMMGISSNVSSYSPQPYQPQRGGGGAAPRGPTGQAAAPREYVSGRTEMPKIDLGKPGGPVWDRLQAVMANPSLMTSDPAYQFLYNQGEQALNRSLAAQRLRYSGKSLADTTKFGQGLASTYFNQMVPQLRGVAGDEYQRWAGPALMELKKYGLGQGDVENLIKATMANNATKGAVGAEQAGQELVDMYRDLMAGMQTGRAGTPEGVGSGGPAIGMGPLTGGYTAPRLSGALPSTKSGGEAEYEGYGYEPYIGMGGVTSQYSPEELAILNYQGPEGQYTI